jgi:hypothetical protein
MTTIVKMTKRTPTIDQIHIHPITFLALGAGKGEDASRGVNGDVIQQHQHVVSEERNERLSSRSLHFRRQIARNNITSAAGTASHCSSGSTSRPNRVGIRSP